MTWMSNPSRSCNSVVITSTILVDDNMPLNPIEFQHRHSREPQHIRFSVTPLPPQTYWRPQYQQRSWSSTSPTDWDVLRFFAVNGAADCFAVDDESRLQREHEWVLGAVEKDPGVPGRRCDQGTEDGPAFAFRAGIGRACAHRQAQHATE